MMGHGPARPIVFHLVGRGPARPITIFRSARPGQARTTGPRQALADAGGPARGLGLAGPSIFIWWAAARPGPSTFQMKKNSWMPGRGPNRPINFSNYRPGPARPVTFSEISARPGPTRHNFQIGPARPGPNHRPMTSPGKFRKNDANKQESFCPFGGPITYLPLTGT